MKTMQILGAALLGYRFRTNYSWYRYPRYYYDSWYVGRNWYASWCKYPR
jgi:hypothetical protein